MKWFHRKMPKDYLKPQRSGDPKKGRGGAAKKKLAPLKYGACHFCGNDRMEYLTYNCPYCGGVFCKEHYLPADHSCPRKKDEMNVPRYAPD